MMKKIVAAAALSLLASAAFAGPTAYYAGVDVNSTKIDGLNDNETGFGAFVGYGFNQNVAVELGYRKLGTWTVYGTDVDLKQTHFSVVGSYPLAPQFDIYGRLGYSNIRGESRYNSASGSNGLYGIGVSYSFTPNVAARLEVQRPSSDATVSGISAVFKF